MDKDSNDTNTEMYGRHELESKAEDVKVAECLSQNIYSLTQEFFLPLPSPWHHIASKIGGILMLSILNI